MTTFIINWCKIMFTQSGQSIRVNTAMCQSGAVSARGKAIASPNYEVVSSLFTHDPAVHIEENTVYLNRREASFVNKEVHRLLRAKLAETQRKKKAGVPLPPEPGKIAYAVYQ